MGKVEQFEMCLLSPVRTQILHSTQVNSFIESIEEVCFQLMMRHSPFITVEKVT